MFEMRILSFETVVHNSSIIFLRSVNYYTYSFFLNYAPCFFVLKLVISVPLDVIIIQHML